MKKMILIFNGRVLMSCGYYFLLIYTMILSTSLYLHSSEDKARHARMKHPFLSGVTKFLPAQRYPSDEARFRDLQNKRRLLSVPDHLWINVIFPFVGKKFKARSKKIETLTLPIGIKALDGDRFVVTCKYEVCVYSGKNPQPECVIPLGCQSRVTSFFGKMIAVVADEGYPAEIWDISSKLCVKRLREDQYVGTIVFLGGTLVAITLDDNDTIRVEDLRKNVCLHTLQGHTDYVNEIIPILGDSDSCYAIASRSEDNTVRCWNLVSGDCISIFKKYGACDAGLVSLSGGRIALGCKGNRIALCSVSSGKCITKLRGHKRRSVNVVQLASLPGDMLASAHDDGIISVWNLKSYKCVQRLKYSTKLMIFNRGWGTFLPDSVMAVRGGYLSIADENAIKTFSLVNDFGLVYESRKQSSALSGSSVDREKKKGRRSLYVGVMQRLKHAVMRSCS